MPLLERPHPQEQHLVFLFMTYYHCFFTSILDTQAWWRGPKYPSLGKCRQGVQVCQVTLSNRMSGRSFWAKKKLRITLLLGLFFACLFLTNEMKNPSEQNYSTYVKAVLGCSSGERYQQYSQAFLGRAFFYKLCGFLHWFPGVLAISPHIPQLPLRVQYLQHL